MIKGKCLLYNKHLDDLGVKTPDIEAKISLPKSEISHWRETVLGDETEVSDKHCMIYMKNGDFFQIDIPFEKVEEIMEADKYLPYRGKKHP